MASLKRRITRALPCIGSQSKWKEDLFALKSLCIALGFATEQLSTEVWPGKKPGHFLPGVVISSGAIEHAFTLDEVPGLMPDAAKAWTAFMNAAPKSPDQTRYEKVWFSELFYSSIAAKPETCDALIQGLTAAGIPIPLDPESLH